MSPPAQRTAYRDSHGRVTLVFYNRPRHCGGTCLYCISDPGFTKSTVANEDTRLARDCGWDPTCQMSKRFARYGLRRGTGAKFGLAVKGDSFTNHDPEYLLDYFRRLYDYLNGEPSASFDEARARQASAPDRCVAVQAETRPDLIDEEWCVRLARLGVTTVELGVQCLDDDVLAVNRRGHGVETVARATALLRDHGFEVGYHMMVGLPSSSFELDLEVLTERLWRREFSPDCIKIYPCILMRNQRLQPQLARYAARTTWESLTDERYRELLRTAYPHIPSAVHVNRIQRLMPPEDIERGPRASIDRATFDDVSRCLWQRSLAQTDHPRDGDFSHVRIRSTPHGTGDCVTATVRDGRVVIGYGRLSAVDGVGLIRDLRVLGTMTPVGAAPTGPQHSGVGRAMLREMTARAAQKGCRWLEVRPAVGSVKYFEKAGFVPSGAYRLRRPVPVPNIDHP